jgi:uridine kinase
MRHVVAVAGPAGGGKTSLVEGLVARLGDACAIHMDSYERMTREPIARVARWAERGADFDELEVPLLGDHLRRLKAGEAIVGPAGGATITPRKYIVFETQFGRAHRATGGLIDLLIWIDTPLDVALARRVRTLCAETLRADSPGAARERLAWIEQYLGSYLDVVRRLLLLQAERVRPQADVVLDGAAGREEVLREALRQVVQRIPSP